MRQNFDVKGGPQLGRQNLPLLRAAMKAQGLDGFYIPHEDEFQNEYLPACNDRLTWATGFTGSAGAAMVFQDTAVIFADGRYTLQVRDQTDRDFLEISGLPDPGPPWPMETYLVLPRMLRTTLKTPSALSFSCSLRIIMNES